MTKEGANQRFHPKRRNNNAKSKHDCVHCDFYSKVEDDPCLWKLEAQIDAGIQHFLEALREVRKLTSKRQHSLRRYLEAKA
jgi:hypothetical protein